MIEGEEIVIKGQIPAPCFHCGICCTLYQPPLYPEDIENIALALGMRMEKGCIFLVWDEEGKACCTIYSFRPKACREWIPSLSKPKCLEGLIKLKSEGQLMLLGKLFDSEEDQETFCSSIKNALSMGGF